MYVENMTIHDAGKYYCKAVWHGYYGDKSWSSPSVDINVYDCIHLEPSNITANVGENVTLQCVDVDVPVKWLKGIY